MKRVIISIVITLAAAFFLFFPWKIDIYEDGGSVTYSSLTYKICVWNSLSGKKGVTEIYYFPQNFKSLTELNHQDNNGEETVNIGLMVKMEDKYYGLYETTIYSYGYSEEADSFAADTGPRLHNLISEGETEEFPIIPWEDDFSLMVPDEVDLTSIIVLDKNGEKVLGLYPEVVDWNGEEMEENGLREYQKYLAQLPEGIYYIAAEVYREGDYIEEKGEYEYSGEQYIFCLEKRF